MKVGMWMGYHTTYPISDPRMPQNMGLQDLFTLGMISPFLDSDDQEEMWSRFELPYRPEVMLNFGTNLMMAIANRETVARSLAKYKFMVSIDLFETETTRFADIALPDCGYLQSFNSRSISRSSSASRPEWANGAGRLASRCSRLKGSSAAIRTCCSNLQTASAFAPTSMPPSMPRWILPRSTGCRAIAAIAGKRSAMPN
jgi:hypothetical protein